MPTPSKKSAELGVFAVIGGLFLSRLMSEWFVLPWFIMITVALMIGALIFVSGRWLNLNLRPSAILLLYLVDPVPNPAWGGWILLGAFVACLLINVKQSRSAHRLAEGWLVGVSSFALYLWTLSPDILPADNGEFQLVAAKLGLAHPPGFSLYTLLAHTATWLPISTTAAYKVNLLSAVTSSLTIIVVYATVRLFSQRPWPAILAAVTLTTSTTFWAQATTANIRSLTALFAAVAFYALIRLYQKTTKTNTFPPTAPPPHRSSAPPLLLFTLALSFGLTHHISLAFIALIMGLFVLWVDPALIRTPRRWPPLLAATAVGLLPWLYLPLRDPSLRHLDAFIDYALGLGFQGDFFYFNTAALLWQRLGVIINILTFQFNEVLLVGMGLSFLLLLWQRPKLAFLFGGSFAIHAFIVASYRAPQAVEYMLPAYIPLVLCLGYGVNWLWEQLSTRSTGQRLLAALTAGFICTAALYQTAAHYPSYRDLHFTTDTRDYTQEILQAAPPDSIILANWHWATPLWYRQQIEGQRPDVEIVYLFPQTADYNAEWVGRIQQELNNGRPVIATYYEEFSYVALPPPYPLGEAFLFTHDAFKTLPDTFTPTDLVLGEQLQITGHQLSQPTIEIGQEMSVTIAWQPLREPLPETRLAVHLVGFDGQIYGQQDVVLRPQPEGLTLTRFWLTPRYGAQPGDFAVRLVASQGEELLTDTNGLPTHTISTLAVQPMSQRPYTANPTYRPLVEDARILIGYDFDNTLPTQTRLYLHWQTAAGYWTQTVDLSPDTPFTLPATHGIFSMPNSQFSIHNPQFTHYVPLGQAIVWTGSTPPLSQSKIKNPQSPITLSQTFHATRPVLRDLGISVRLLGFEPDGVTWAWRTPDAADNDIPALGGIPTLKWIAGSTIYHPRTLAIDPAAYAGQQIGGLVRPYDVFTNRPLPILDERLTNQRPWIPLSTTIFE